MHVFTHGASVPPPTNLLTPRGARQVWVAWRPGFLPVGEDTGVPFPFVEETNGSRWGSLGKSGPFQPTLCL